jgi:hypothetical protein
VWLLLAAVMSFSACWLSNVHFMYWKIQSNITYIDYVMIRLHVSTIT